MGGVYGLSVFSDNQILVDKFYTIMSRTFIIHYPIIACTEYYFEKVKSEIEKMNLDNRCLDYRQFLVTIHSNNELMGFGRIREYEDCAEVCSVGVLEAFRKQGIGKSIVKKLIQLFRSNNEKPIYVVTIIPDFFEKLNFKIVQAPYPLDIQEKLEYCIHNLTVPEEYVVLRLLSSC